MTLILVFFLGLFVGIAPTLWRYAIVVVSLLAAAVLLVYVKVMGLLLYDANHRKKRK